MINIPSVFYGSSIKKGSISLKTYISGSLIAEATDSNRRGELVYDNTVIGTVLYDEVSFSSQDLLFSEVSWCS